MRKKVKLAFMVSDSARKITYNKRKKSFAKKIDELSTLCGIDVCAIVYSDFQPEPELWPSPCEVQRIITKYRNCSEFEQGKKKLDQESYLKQRIEKTREQSAKLERSNGEMLKSLLLSQSIVNENLFTSLNLYELNLLTCGIDEKLAEIAAKENDLATNVASTSGFQLP